MIHTNLNDNRIKTIIGCVAHTTHKFGIFLKSLYHTDSKNRTVNNAKFITYDENHKCKHTTCNFKPNNLWFESISL